MNRKLNIEPLYRTNLILWAAFLISQFLFLVVIFFAKPNLFSFDFTKSLLGNNAIVTFVFAFLALMNLALSFFMKSQNLQSAIEQQNPEAVQSGMIVAYALCESITIFGLVLAFAFDYQYFFLWFAVGILGIILHFPKREDYIAAIYKK